MCFSHELFFGPPPLTTMTCGEHQKFRWGLEKGGGTTAQVSRDLSSPLEVQGRVRGQSPLSEVVLGSSIWVLSVGRARHPGWEVSDLPIGSALSVLTLDAGWLMGTLRWRVRPTFCHLLTTGVPQLGLGPFVTIFGSAQCALQFGLLLARTWCLVVMLLWV